MVKALLVTAILALGRNVPGWSARGLYIVCTGGAHDDEEKERADREHLVLVGTGLQ